MIIDLTYIWVIGTSGDFSGNYGEKEIPVIAHFFTILFVNKQDFVLQTLLLTDKRTVSYIEL